MVPVPVIEHRQEDTIGESISTQAQTDLHADVDGRRCIGTSRVQTWLVPEYEPGCPAAPYRWVRIVPAASSPAPGSDRCSRSR